MGLNYDPLAGSINDVYSCEPVWGYVHMNAGSQGQGHGLP